MRTSFLVVGSVAMAVVLGGCTGVAPESEEDRLAVEASALWQWSGATLWPDGIVPVCWTQASTEHPDFPVFSERVQRVVEDNWGRVAALRFTGWGTCPEDRDGIIGIEIADWRGNSDAGGFGQAFGERTLEFGGDRNNDGVILHEFGHELGFLHEFDRPDFPDHDGCVASNFSGDGHGTPPDDESIMTETYCNNNNKLSGWDIVGVQNAYGHKASGAVVSAQGRCVDIPFASTSSVNLELYDCHGGENQRWFWQPDRTLLTSVSSTTMCMDVSGGVTSPSSGTPVANYTCHAGTNQQWSFDDVNIVGIGGKCLDVPAADYFAGQVVAIYECHGGANQLWTLGTDGSIQAGSSGLCLDVPNGVGSSGLDLQLWPCHGGPSQQFSFTSDGEIKFGSLCVDSEWGDPTDGRLIQLYDCKASNDLSKANQRYHLRGAVHGLDGQCLDVWGGVPSNNTPVQVYPCHGGANQVWDYYF